MSSWRSEDQESLRKALQLRGLDETSFARSAAISLAQLRELVHGGEGQFYSTAIKAHVGYKLLRRLGLEPAQPPALSQATADPGLASETAPPTSNRPNIRSTPPPTSGQPVMQTPAMAWKFGTGAWLLLGCGLLIGLLALPPWRTTGTVFRTSQNLSQEAVIPPSVPTVQTLKTESSERPMEPALVSAPAIAPAPASPAQDLTASTLPTVPGSCDWGRASDSASFQTDGPTKVGNYVHFVAERSATVCVVDQARKVTQFLLKEGEARSVYGEGPFLVHLERDAAVKLFFQGRRVSVPPSSSGLLVLQPVPLG